MNISCVLPLFFACARTQICRLSVTRRDVDDSLTCTVVVVPYTASCYCCHCSYVCSYGRVALVVGVVCAVVALVLEGVPVVVVSCSHTLAVVVQ